MQFQLKERALLKNVQQRYKISKGAVIVVTFVFMQLALLHGTVANTDKVSFFSMKKRSISKCRIFPSRQSNKCIDKDLQEKRLKCNNILGLDVVDKRLIKQ